MLIQHPYTVKLLGFVLITQLTSERYLGFISFYEIYRNELLNHQNSSFDFD